MSGIGQGATFDFQLLPKWRQNLYQPGNRSFRNPVMKAHLFTLFNFFHMKFPLQ